jgi:hypothetical protein
MGPESTRAVGAAPSDPVTSGDPWLAIGPGVEKREVSELHPASAPETSPTMASRAKTFCPKVSREESM